MEKYKTIEIVFKDGSQDVWDANKGEWDDYSYDGRMFIVKKSGQWVGFYNIDSVISIVVN